MPRRDMDRPVVHDVRVVIEDPAAGETGPIHDHRDNDCNGQQHPRQPFARVIQAHAFIPWSIWMLHGIEKSRRRFIRRADPFGGNTWLPASWTRLADGS